MGQFASFEPCMRANWFNGLVSRAIQEKINTEIPKAVVSPMWNALLLDRIGNRIKIFIEETLFCRCGILCPLKSNFVVLQLKLTLRLVAFDEQHSLRFSNSSWVNSLPIHDNYRLNWLGFPYWEIFWEFEPLAQYPKLLSMLFFPVAIRVIWNVTNVCPSWRYAWKCSCVSQLQIN